ncbi:hypothetical protein GDO86_020017 [Hymenochirus boettgeri]|uniref:Uncharacterized protein n=1 Tax=Hymenochirus boettgeri TaxID=247094 RepID=A0A8T2IFX9_9PIPI|nr:hypothetical protein GDO86_020017 [Hymenochirus boettgeri]
MDTIPELTEYIKNFTLDQCPRGNQGYDRVLLQLFGFLGHGKSSFINTCKYVLDDGEFKVYADVTKTQGGNTTARITYPLTDTMTLVDNRGCSVMNNYEIAEIYAQLANLLPLDVGVEWNKGFGLADRIVEAESSIKSSDFIFPIFVYSVKKGLAYEEMEELKDLLQYARDLTEIFPVVVLTHKTSGDLADVTKKFINMGAEQIFALDNFTPDDNIRTRGRHEDILNFFCEVIKDITFRLERTGDPVQKKMERKKKVLNFVYEREMRNKDEEIKRSRMNEERMKRQMEEKKDEGGCTVS